MKVVLATGVIHVNAQIENKFKDEIEVVAKPLFREAVESSVKRTQADVVVISDELDGELSMQELILLLRARHPKTRLIYIGKNLTPEFKAFLYKLTVYDTLDGKFTEAQLRSAFFHPKTWEDVSSEIPDLIEYQTPYSLPDINQEEISYIKPDDYKKIKASVKSKDSIYQEIVAFWSVLNQSGKTFLATNTALFLAANPDLNILLIDFSIKNPTVHLFYGFQNADKNLGALAEDLELDPNMKLNAKTIEEYLITHPVYKNLKILPGFILKSPEKEPEYYIKLTNEFLKTAKSMNFSTILMDMDSGLIHPFFVYLLRKSTKILMSVTESSSHLNAVMKTFDPEVGEFVPASINKKKVFPILNRATEPYYSKFCNELDAIIDGNKTRAIIMENPDIHVSTMEGTPFLTEINDEKYQLFFQIANIIHPGLFKAPKDDQNSAIRKFIFFKKKPKS